MGFAGYFLIVWDIINFARSRGIPVGPGRGSSAGSLVAYALRITDLDPLVYGLLFERFLNPERISLPDIEINFSMEHIQEVIKYDVEKYDEDHVCQIITFGTMKAKAAIRDVGRVMEMPYAEVDRIAKLVPDQLNITLDAALETEPRLKDLVETDHKIREVFETARALEKSPRHASTHAAGVVISQDSLTAHVPLYKGSKETDEIVTQYPMGDVEKVGLVKFDLLGLKTLTMIAHAERLIKARLQGEPFSVADLPLNDPQVFALLSSGKTMGLFQLESAGMRDLLTGLRPDRFEDIIAIIALYRPGPMDLIPDFIKRKQGKIPITYEVPVLEEILKETYGVIVYQEQVMAIANKVAGFSLGQADLLRRAMGKQKPEERDKLRTQFIEGAKKRKITEKKAEKLFELIQKFAGYGFNKSHAAAYALVTCQTAYLKAHNPTEFMAALLTSEMGNTDKVVRYINECRDLGIKVLPPDVNESDQDFTVTQDGIRFGLAAIKNVGEGAIEAIIDARKAQGPYITFFDFCHRVDVRKLNKRALECLIKAGAFDSTGAGRAQLAAVLDRTVDQAMAAQRAESRGQTSIFAAFESPDGQGGRRGTLPFDESLPDMPEWDKDQLLKYEKELTGFYITSHPLARYAEAMSQFSTASTDALSEVADAKEVRLCGIIAAVRQTMTKKGDRMAYLTLEDLHGTVEVIVFPDLYKTAAALIIPESVVQVIGTLDRGDKAARVKATRLAGLADLQAQSIACVSIQVTTRDASAEILRQLRDVLHRHAGPCPVYLTFTIPDHSESVIAVGPDLRVLPSAQLVGDVEALIGKGSIALE